jgi:hypothetical protein
MCAKQFHDYTGEDGNEDNGIQYFLEKFLAKNTQKKEIRHYVSSCIDAQEIQTVFDGCLELILGSDYVPIQVCNEWANVYKLLPVLTTLS